LSRYEEYLPHVKDKEGKFPASESLAYREGFLLIPVIDVWALKLKKILQERYPEYNFLLKKAETENVIAVTEAFCYRKKGIVRAVLGFFMDIFQLKVKYVVDRFKVMTGFKKDPFDNYNAIIKFLKKYKIRLKFMFQISDFSTYDRNINHNRLEFQSLIKSVADYAEVGLQPGFYANQSMEVLKQEKMRLENILKRTVESVLNNKYNLLLPDAYKIMAELEFKRDYSMGYPQTFGFRAGTCSPFLFYDIHFEVTTPLQINPYAINIKATSGLTESDIDNKINTIMENVKFVKGKLVAIFSNEDFSEYSNAKRNFSILKRINEIN
ncbi:MAG TPA: polysaccharide deacetylase family protein, partial [Salinimicrobium sp.]|nr:polysaccharide deacetylase family protein [Salinimicrobium sp.]